MTAARSVGVPVERVPPGQRFGWVLASVWLVFLGYPLYGVLTTDGPAAARWVGGLALLAFAAVYVAGFRRLGRAEGSVAVRPAGTSTAALAALCLLVAAVQPLAALGMVPFVTAYAMFVLPLKAALTVTALGVAVAMLLPVYLGVLADAWFFLVVVFVVAATTVIERLIDVRERRHHELMEEMRVVAERERLSRDLHDVLGHSLTVVAAKAELAERYLEHDSERSRAELEQIQDLTREALAEVRATVAGLRIVRLGEELAAARAALTTAGVAADVPTDVDTVDPRHRIVVAWVLREAVTNVVRHSGAQHCRVSLSRSGVEVADDGHGVKGRPWGNGLHGMRERVETVGGTLVVEDRADGPGTRVAVNL